MKLALHGGTPVRTRPFPPHVTIGAEEKEAACRVLDSGVLSRYLGAWHEDFMGGEEVRALEKEWAAYFKVKHAIAVNSATSGLICALGAAGIKPGDEVIVGPWSMSISATAPLFYGATPVFADVEPDCFCLNPADVAPKITPRTKAILAVDLFGQPYDAKQINALAKQHGLLVIEDAAQAPGGSLHGKASGTLGDIGVFSLNYHKHIHCGEGGIVATDDDKLAKRVRLIRNHAEAVVEGMGVADLSNMLGYNFRMTELEAAIARCQLTKLEQLNKKRLQNVSYLENGLQHIPCLTTPKVRAGAKHVYYVHACLYDEQATNVSARQFMEALRLELPHITPREKEVTKLGVGYVRPLYKLPLFQNQPAKNEKWPFFYHSDKNYKGNLCPVCEELHAKKLLTHEFMLPGMGKKDLDDVLEAFEKVWKNRNKLR